MKQNILLKEAMNLIKENDNYIIFNDGKAIRSNIPESIDILVNDYFDSNEYYKRKKSTLENEILDGSKFSTTIAINESTTIKIIHINYEEKYFNCNLVIKENVQANIINIYYHTENEAKQVLEIVSKRNSSVSIKSITNSENKITNIVNAYVLENAYINIDDLGINDKEVESKTNVYLLEEMANVNLTNVVLNTSSLLQDYKYIINHIEKNTQSLTKNYGISKNSSYLVFDNYGIINKGAKNTILSQKTKGIILDMYSSISANPLLQIDENDVMANHGASIGAIDEEDLYYLMSRGLSREVSEGLIVNAFITPYFTDIIDEKVIDYIRNEIAKRL